MAEEALLVFSTFGSAEEARRAVRTLVEERLAACGTIIPGVESIYRWEGAIEQSTEVQVILKTVAARYWQVESRLRELHAYEVPEILAVAVQQGLPAYLRWLDDACVHPA